MRQESAKSSRSRDHRQLDNYLMPEDSIVIIGTGVLSAVGLSTVETAASVRARVARFSEIDYYDRELSRFTVAEVSDDALPPLAAAVESVRGLTSRELRMLRLATRPLRECLLQLPNPAEPIGLALALPESHGDRPNEYSLFLQCLSAQCLGTFSPQLSNCSLRGRAGGVGAIGYAIDVIRSGQAGMMLAGGVDTYRDLYTL